MIDRAYSVLQIKAVDEDQRIIEGIASTPGIDRAGDIVDPMGVVLRKRSDGAFDVPVKWQHGNDPRIGDIGVGYLTHATPRADGIPVRIQIAKSTTPGLLKDALDYVWEAVKLRLVGGLSVGFRPLKREPVKGTFGERYSAWEMLELSLVTIPANSEATITLIKSYDSPAASGNGQSKSPGVSGTSTTPYAGVRTVIYSVAENIKTLENSRAAKQERLLAIAQKAAGEGRTKDEAEQTEHAELVTAIMQIDAELKDANDLQRIVNNKAVAVNGATPEVAAATRGGTAVRVHTPEPEKGIRFARYVKCLGVAMKHHRDPEVIARQMYPDDYMVQKATVAAGSTASGNWAVNLVSEEGAIAADFAEYLRPQTILGKFGTGGVPALRRVPFRSPLVAQTAGGTGYWVGEGKAKPLTKFDFSRTSLAPLKTANIAVLTMENLRDSSPASDGVVRDALADALREVEDQTFINPDTAAVSNVSPASILNGITQIWSSGTDSDAIRADIASLFGAFLDANNPPTAGVFIMPTTIALRVSLLRTLNGSEEFPGLTMTGGTLAGLPVITSEYVTSDDYGAIVALVNARDIFYADDGGVAVDTSTEASLEMSDAPSHNSTTPTAAQLVSLWQTNSVGFRAEHTVNWARRRDSAVAFLGGVEWAT